MPKVENISHINLLRPSKNPRTQPHKHNFKYIPPYDKDIDGIGGDYYCCDCGEIKFTD